MQQGGGKVAAEAVGKVAVGLAAFFLDKPLGPGNGGKSPRVTEDLGRDRLGEEKGFREAWGSFGGLEAALTWEGELVAEDIEAVLCGGRALAWEGDGGGRGARKGEGKGGGWAEADAEDGGCRGARREGVEAPIRGSSSPEASGVPLGAKGSLKEPRLSLCVLHRVGGATLLEALQNWPTWPVWPHLKQCLLL